MLWDPENWRPADLLYHRDLLKKKKPKSGCSQSNPWEWSDILHWIRDQDKNTLFTILYGWFVMKIKQNIIHHNLGHLHEGNCIDINNIIIIIWYIWYPDQIVYDTMSVCAKACPKILKHGTSNSRRQLIKLKNASTQAIFLTHPVLFSALQQNKEQKLQVNKKIIKRIPAQHSLQVNSFLSKYFKTGHNKIKECKGIYERI